MKANSLDSIFTISIKAILRDFILHYMSGICSRVRISLFFQLDYLDLHLVFYKSFFFIPLGFSIGVIFEYLNYVTFILTSYYKRELLNLSFQ